MGYPENRVHGNGVSSSAAGGSLPLTPKNREPQNAVRAGRRLARAVFWEAARLRAASRFLGVNGGEAPAAELETQLP